jgi:two-component system, OmpR family, sensor histidine kinase BaeS
MKRSPAGSLGIRLAAAFVGVSLSAIAVLAVLTVLSARSELTDLGGGEASSTTKAVTAFADALQQTVAIGASLAAALAVLVALVVSRWITRPVKRLIRVTRVREAGDRDARVGPLRAPSEIAELAVAFDQMADAIGHEDKLRRALAADVAHELRTPLGVLQATCEAMLDGFVEPNAEAISSLRDEVLRMGRRVEDLQVLASAEATGLPMATQPVELATVVRDAVASFEAHFAAAEITLTADLTDVTVAGDAGRLHQIVANLLSNALKFTPPRGSVRVVVAAAGRGATLTVTDTGVGIPQQELGRVFDRFFRGSAAASSAGSGIGLAVAAELAKAHRGRIEVRSELGAGASFVLFLPAG